MKASVVLGTRPEIIRMSPIIKELMGRKVEFFILHSGQHYSYEMNIVFFEQLGLPEPKYNLQVGSGTQAEETENANWNRVGAYKRVARRCARLRRYEHHAGRRTSRG